jgi:uncharacterized membrane protein YbhN (UPF0104 family)
MLLLRLLIAAAILGGILLHTGVDNLLAPLASAKWPWLLLVFSLMLAETLLRARTWKSILQIAGIDRLSYPALLRCYLASSFAGSLIPTSAGTDVLRAIFAARLAARRVTSFAASLVLLNLLNLWVSSALGLVALGVNVASHGAAPWHWPLALLFLGVTLTVPTVWSLLRHHRRVLFAAASALFRPWPAVRRTAMRFLRSLLLAAPAGASLAGPVVLGCFSITVNALGLAVIGHSLGVAPSFEIWLLLPSLLALVGLLPLSFMGFGATQAAIVAVLAWQSVAPGAALGIGIISSALWMLLILAVGGAAFLLQGQRSPD